ncbi:hypothetical protein D1872_188280 [compost metagenome]
MFNFTGDEPCLQLCCLQLRRIGHELFTGKGNCNIGLGTVRSDIHFFFIGFFFIPVNKQYLDARINAFGLRIILGTEHQLRCIIVFDFSGSFCHDLLKNKVRTVDHFTAAAKVFGKIDSLTASRSITGIRLILMQEKAWFGQTKPVDGLLHISYHKQIAFRVPVFCYKTNDRLLHLIRILILIDKYFTELRPIFQCRSGWQNPVRPGLFITQNLQAVVFQIREIDQSFCLLQGTIAFTKTTDQLNKLVDKRRHLAGKFEIVLRRNCEHFSLQVRYRIFYSVTQFFCFLN